MRGLALGLLLVALAGCTDVEPRRPAGEADVGTPVPQPLAVPADSVAGGIGHRIYVPVYSHIYYRENRIINLTATLSVRNTDAAGEIFITDVDYYDSSGRLVRRYLAAPLQLGAMASKDFVVDEDDASGGSGANFIVTWRASTPVTAPVVEAVMISTASTQGISFVTEGRVLTPVQVE